MFRVASAPSLVALPPLLALLALVGLASACGDDESAEGGGTGGNDASSSSSSGSGSTSTGEVGPCELPSTEMPRGTLTDPDGVPVTAISGAVVVSEEHLLVVDTCFAPDADCEATRFTLTMSGGLSPTVPLGTLVEVTITEADPIRDADKTPTVRVTNLPELQDVTNPTMTQPADWFLSTTAYTCAHPGLAVSTLDRCEGTGVRRYALVIEGGAQDDELDEGDVVTSSLNGLHEVSFLGGWTEGPGELGSCRWQVGRLGP